MKDVIIDVIITVIIVAFIMGLVQTTKRFNRAMKDAEKQPRC